VATLAGMYVQGVSTRKVKAIPEEPQTEQECRGFDATASNTLISRFVVDLEQRARQPCVVLAKTIYWLNSMPTPFTTGGTQMGIGEDLVGSGGGVVADTRRQSPAHLIRLWLASLLVVLLAPAELAQTAPAASKPDWVGVWRGTVGNAAVQVCLQHEDYGDLGAYYYLRHLKIISLGRLGSRPVWTESPKSDQAAKGPLWQFTTISSSHLQGSWSQGAKTLPFSLDRVPLAKANPDDTNDTACGNEAFSLPRFSKPVVTSKTAVLNGIGYTRVLVDPGKQFDDSSTEVFQLQGATAAIKRVNAELYKNVPTSPNDAEYFTCSMAALGQNGLDGDASTTIKPLLLTKSWMVLENDESDDCGGAHPNSNVSYETWDLRKGVKINLYDWFNKAALTQTINEPGSKDQYVSVAFTAPFKKLIDHAYSLDDEECKDTLADADAWDPSLTATGIAFTPELPHAVQACEEEAEIPFAILAPYLNPTGKVAIAAFHAEMRGLK
jgi:hypothetical protein